MSTDVRAIVESHWKLANDREWVSFAELLHPALRYDLPQTREYIESGYGYCEMFRTWPGNWVASIQHLVCETNKVICIINFKVDQDEMTGISIFEVSQGKITRVIDYWPGAYDPPARETPYLKRAAP